MELISYHAILSSSLLARERGAYSSYKGSKWDRNIFPVDTIALLEKSRGVEIPVSKAGKLDWSPVRASVKQYGMRNSNCMAMAPTATISNIVGSIPCIEPIYKNIYVKSNMNGEFIIVNPYLVTDLKALNLWDFEMIGLLKYNDGSVKDIPSIPAHLKDKYKEVFQIDPSWIIKSAAYRGKWVDQSQSLNIYFAGTSGKELASIYEYAWSLGLKTTYYLRSLGASQVEKSTVNASEFGSTHKRGSENGKDESIVSLGGVSSSSVVGAVASAVTSSVNVSEQTEVASPVMVTKSIEQAVRNDAAVSQMKYKITVMPEATCDGCQ
jgi:ribonucleoside-diphosphate reductase alpha chain